MRTQTTEELQPAQQLGGSHAHGGTSISISISHTVLKSAYATRNSHRLGWHRLGYGEMTEELRVPCDHLENLHLLRASVLKLALF